MKSQNEIFTGFDFDDFLSSKGLSSSIITLPRLFSEQLLETLGVKGFFSDTPCNRSNYAATSSGFEIGMLEFLIINVLIYTWSLSHFMPILIFTDFSCTENIYSFLSVFRW
jgi:hypothetical protein